MKLKGLVDLFYNTYGKNNTEGYVYFSPGRVNLIGEHTDYNGGYVFPCALSFGTYLLIAKNNSDKLRFRTTNFGFTKEVPVSEIKKYGNEWINYPLGVIDQFIKEGLSIEGMDFLYSGDIPNGAGLSSSASIEVVTAKAINDMYNIGMSLTDIALLGQRAENQFVGVNCGIMDQFAVANGKENHAIFLNCDTLDYEQVPVKLEGYKLIISNTNKRRGLADSKYNERRSECDKAVEYISKKQPIKLLGELSMNQFEELKDAIPDEVVMRRARHVVSEIDRVLVAVKELKNDQLDKFGALMNGSHDSLRDDYEVTGLELDTLVEEARKIDGVIGSRMTGAGFGGCTVSLVKEEAVESFKKEVGPAYKRITGIAADFYVAEIGDGVKLVEKFN